MALFKERFYLKKGVIWLFLKKGLIERKAQNRVWHALCSESCAAFCSESCAALCSESCAALCSESCAALCLAVGSKDDCATIVKVQRDCAYIVWSDVNRVNE